MHFSAASYAALLALTSSLASAQTSTKCNPLQGTCPADKALGKTVDIDFTQGPSSEFTADGSYFTYNSNGAQLAVKEHGNSPTYISNWYIMFGRVDVVMQSSPGTGMVSSIVLQSDDLDEIDFEMLGYQPSQGQTNYFGKGITGSYNRGLTISDPGSTTEFNTYSIDWNAERINWEINGAIVRTLTAADAEANQYPQTPMQLKIGSWAPGDPSEPQGTISWAGGDINYANGPYVFQVKSVKVQDYSTGSEYKYQGTSGTWQSIQAVGGTVGSQGTASSGSTGTQPGSSNSQPNGSSMLTSLPATFTTIPSGTHKTQTGTDSHTGYPWVSSSASSTPSSASSSSASITGVMTSSAPSGTPTITVNSGSPVSVAIPNSALLTGLVGLFTVIGCLSL